jgi:hypothetical protein
MKSSKLVAGVLSIAIVGGAAYGLARSDSSLAASPEMVCSSDLLTFKQQNDCKQQLKAASSTTAQKQIAADFQAKIDARKAAANADTNGASTSSGGDAMTPASPAPAPDANAAPSAPDSSVPQR